jgi:copper ion binding protein
VTTTSTYKVQGMTCEHCVRAVTEEVAKLDGVEGIEVELASGDVIVTSSLPVTDEQMRAAVDEAGYELVK